MAHTTFDSSDLGAFTRLGCLGLEVTGPARGEEADSVGLPYHWRWPIVSMMQVLGRGSLRAHKHASYRRALR